MKHTIANHFLVFSILIALVVTGCQSPSMSQEEQQSWKDEGKRSVMEAGQLLKSNLINAIADSGLVHAVNFCHVEAQPLADSASESLGYAVSRVVLKARNKKNKARGSDRQILQMLQKAHNQGDTLQPVLVENPNKELVYYHPIMIEPLCLNCHGEVRVNINEPTFNALRAHYPNGKAMGYHLGDFRGAWKVILRSKGEGS